MTPVTPTTYSSDINVSEKISHITLPPKIVVGNFRDEAYTYINTRLRGLYLTPVSGSLQSMGFLKHMESNMAAGKILLAVGTTNTSSELSEYGQMLINMAQKSLDLVLGGDGKPPKVVLEGASLDIDKSDNASDFPIMVLDSPDAVSTFSRPASGVENDAILGVVDNKIYNSQEDIAE